MRTEIPALSRIDWQLFLTLTLKDEKRSDDWAVKRYFALMRQTASWNKVHFLDLLWCLRSEKGDRTGRRHYHALWGGLPEYTIHRHTCFAIKNEAEALGLGMTRVYVFNRNLDGVGYLLKGLEACDEMRSQGQSLYEFSKFQSSLVMLSISILRAISGREHRGQT